MKLKQEIAISRSRKRTVRLALKNGEYVLSHAGRIVFRSRCEDACIAFLIGWNEDVA
jgi:hypothetical protein